MKCFAGGETREIVRPPPWSEHDSLRRNGVAFAFAGPCDASQHPWHDAATQPWFDRPDAMQTIERRAAAGEVSEDDAVMLEAPVIDKMLPNLSAFLTVDKAAFIDVRPMP